MSGARLTDAGDGRLRVEGVLGFDTVTRLLAESSPRFLSGRQLLIDLSGVTSANSAGIALLLEWMDLAQARGVGLAFAGLPESIRRLAAISNLTALLPVQDPQ